MARLNKLKAQMVEQMMPMEKLADAMGVHVSTLYRKFRYPDTFLVWEVKKIQDALSLSDEQLVTIFFDG